MSAMMPWREMSSPQLPLMKVADTYDKEVRNTIDRLLAIFTPFITLLMAVMIGTIVMSVLMAIMGINELVG